MLMQYGYYAKEIRWDCRLTFVFFMPSLFLIFSLWRATVLYERFRIVAISFVPLPCLIREATLISAGVNPKELEDSLRENGETISCRLDSIISSKAICVSVSLPFFNF